jgi:hypothetical protein
MGAAADRVWAMVSGLPSGKRERRNLMVLQAVADDSGNEPGSEPLNKFFVFGGFVADSSTWARFSDEWDKGLNEHPRIEYFKMAEANGLRDQFDGWTLAARDEKLEKLSHIVARYPLAVIDVSIKHTDFSELISSIYLPDRGLSTDKPYPILANQLMVALGDYQRRMKATEEIDIFFDTQLGFEEELHRWWPLFEILKEEETQTNFSRYISGPPNFRDEKKFLPLQAADMYVWHKHRHLEGSENVFNPRPQILRRLCYGKWCLSLPIGREVLIGVRENLLKQVDAFVEANPDVPLVGPGKQARRRSRAQQEKPKRAS